MATERRRFYIVDDNLAMASTAKVVLENAGYEATIQTSPEEALVEIPRARPDCVLLDIMMPGIDGMEVCRRLRATEGLEDLKIIMFTAKTFKHDRQRAAEVGADGYITKPIKTESFLRTIEKVVSDQMVVTFWGVRGTLPRPGTGSVRYGGNTSCVSLELPGGQLLVFDAGTGIKTLADDLMGRGTRLEGKILLSHPHWDHINCLPFFSPLYVTGNEFEILGATQPGLTVRDLVSSQMDGVYFPITMREFGAKVDFRDLQEGEYEIAGLTVRTMLLSHPGNCLGYRVEYGNRSFCYLTDNEFFPRDSDEHSEEYVERLADFARGTEVLITDACYTDAEYPDRIGFGHSSVSQVVDFAHRAEAKNLYLFHHDPDQDDDAIDRKLATARELLGARSSKTECIAPAEGDVVRV